jgi:hypothetical protein
MRAGTTGGVSVRASAAARVVAGWEPATVGWPGVPDAAVADGADGVEAPPLDGPAVSDPIDIAASSAALRARTSGVRIPSSSCMSASRNRDASQRMM